MRSKAAALWAIAVLSAAVLVWTVRAGPLVFPDTAGYLAGSVFRPLGYPLILRAFGAGTALVLLQTLSVLAASFFGAGVLQRRFALPPWTLALFFFMLATPLLPSKSLYASTYGHIGRAVLTEALSYAAFTAAFALLVESAFEPRAGRAPAFLGWSLAALLLRSQMVFMLPLALPLARRAGRTLLAGAAAIVLTMAVAGLAQRLYLRAFRGPGFVPQRASAVLLLPVAYLSGPEDAEALAPADREAFQDALSRLDADQASARFAAQADATAPSFYLAKVGRVVDALNGAMAKAHGEGRADYDPVADLNGFAKRALPVLLRRHLKDCVRLWGGVFLLQLNFREGFFCAVLLLAFLLPLDERTRTALALTAALALCNRTLLALSFGNGRHLFYTNTAEQVLCAAVLLKKLERA